MNIKTPVISYGLLVGMTAGGLACWPQGAGAAEVKEAGEAPTSGISFAMESEPGEGRMSGAVAQVEQVFGKAGFFDVGWPVHWDVTLEGEADGPKQARRTFRLTPLTLVVSRDGQWRGFESLRAGQKVELLGPRVTDARSDHPVRVVILPEDSTDVPDKALELSSLPSASLWQGTQGNLTLRVTRAGWFDRRQILGDTVTNKAPLFGMMLEVVGPPPRRAAHYGLRVAPSGLVRSVNILDRPIALASAAPNNTNAVFFSSENIDPRWDKMTFQVEALDPLAPEGADGVFRSLLEWKDIEVGVGKGAIAVNKTFTTALGTRVTLESVEFREQNTRCRFRVQASQRVPEAEMELLGHSMRDDQGRISRFGFGGESRDGEKWEQTNSEKPAKDARRVSLTFQLVESAPALADARWLRHFRFSLSPLDLREKRFGDVIPSEFDGGGSPEKFTAAVVAHSSNRDVTADLEMRPDDWSGQQGWRFWLRPTDSKSPLVWKLRELRVRADGKVVPVRLDYFPDEPQFIRADGDWVSAGTRSDRAEVQMPDAAPNRVEVEGEVEALQRLEHRGHWVWPLPVLGKPVDLTVQKPVRDGLDKNEFFHPVKLVAFRSLAELPGVPGSWNEAVPGEGLALVVKLDPMLKANVDEQTLMALDDTGADLRVVGPGLETCIMGDATRRAGAKFDMNTVTFLLGRPRDGAKKVEAWLFVAETRPVKRSRIQFSPISRQVKSVKRRAVEE